MQRGAKGQAGRRSAGSGGSRWVSFAIGVAAFLVYLAQAPSVAGDKDSGEFTLVLALGGVAHPTGYPLFTMLGWAWTQAVHALGTTWAYAANSWTALGGGVAMYALHRLGLALLAGTRRADRAGRALGPAMRHLVAALPVAWMAFNPLWTYETTLAEVYAWHVAWALTTATVFLADLRALDGPRGAPVSRIMGRAALWGVLCGVGAVHHATFVFVAAPLSAVLAWRLFARGVAQPRVIALGVIATLLPLSTYAWILLRGAHPGPAVFPMLRPGLSGLVEHMTARIYGRLVGGFHPSVEQVGLLREYLWPVFVPAGACLVALFLLARRPVERWGSGALLAAAGLSTVFAFRYGATDPSSYFLVPLALALAALPPLLAGFIEGPPSGRGIALVASGVLALAAVTLWVPWNRTAFERARLFKGFDSYVGSMWHAIPFDSAFVFWANDMHTTLLARQELGHDKPGLVVLHPLELMSEQPRRRFIERYGFDPWTPAAATLDEIGRRSWDDSLALVAADSVEAHVNALTRWPVVQFDPRHGSVRLLKKPDR
jgi:hypothetical protein